VKDARALGREFSQRAAQPGSTGERLDAERDARSNFTGADVHAAKVVGGDEISYTIYTAVTTQLKVVELSAKDLDLDLAYVRPPGFARPEAALRSRRIVVLRGKADSGRYAFARHLLLRLSVGPVRRLHPETDLGSITSSDLDPGGYLLADLTPQNAARLLAFDLDRLSGELGPSRAMVITVAEGVPFSDPDVEQRVIGVAGCDVQAVLEAHLARIVGQPEQASAILADADVSALCKEQLLDARPAVAVRLATLLGTAEQPIAATVRAKLTVKQPTDIEGWFSKLTDLDTQTLALGVAVLGGEPYELVAGASDSLKRRLEPPDQPPRAASPFGATRGSRLRALNAHLVPSEMTARHGGTAPGLVVRFEDRTLAKDLLLHIWDEYDELRPELLNWLRVCAGSEVPTVRVRAAVATGILAARAFDHVRSTIILPWARSKDPNLRDAAAAALGVAADRPDLRDAVLGLVSAWSADDFSAELRATAIRAWRVALSEEEGSTASIALLERLGGDDDPVVVEAVCESVAEMLEYKECAFSSSALALLLSWVKSRNPERRTTAKLAFLLSAADLVREVPGRGYLPTLLDLGVQDPATATKIAALWAVTLNSADLNRAAKEVLSEWARLADAGFAGSSALGRLMAAVATDDRTSRIIALAAAGWTRAPRSKAAVLAAVPSGRSTP